MPEPLTATQLARQLADVLNRVDYRREPFVVIRGKRALAELRPLPTGTRRANLPSRRRRPSGAPARATAPPWRFSPAPSWAPSTATPSAPAASRRFIQGPALIGLRYAISGTVPTPRFRAPTCYAEPTHGIAGRSHQAARQDGNHAPAGRLAVDPRRRSVRRNTSATTCAGRTLRKTMRAAAETSSQARCEFAQSDPPQARIARGST